MMIDTKQPNYPVSFRQSLFRAIYLYALIALPMLLIAPYLLVFIPVWSLFVVCLIFALIDDRVRNKIRARTLFVLAPATLLIGLFLLAFSLQGFRLSSGGGEGYELIAPITAGIWVLLTLIIICMYVFLAKRIDAFMSRLPLRIQWILVGAIIILCVILRFTSLFYPLHLMSGPF